jgi:group I intron endonuclease
MGVYNEFGIYRITNKTNGMTYVGKTGMNFGDRWDCHRAQLNGGYHDNRHLQNAWNKYGADAFEFDVIEKVSDVSKLNELEIKYIAEYRDIGKCYNISDGGDGGFLLGKHLSEETKRKIGEKNRVHMTGRKMPESVRAKMSESHKKRYENWADEDRKKYGEMMSVCARGYKWSDESKKAFSELQRIRPNGAKLNIDIVHEIRRLHEEESKSYTDISKLLNVPRSNVYNIATYRRWATV